AFDFGACRPVVVDPLGISLLVAGIGKTLLVAAHADGAPASRVGAVSSHRTVGAGLGESGDPVAVMVAVDVDGDLRWTGDGVIVEVNDEEVFGEQPARGGGRLGLAARIDVVLNEMVQELAGAVGSVAIHPGPLDPGVPARVLIPA